MSDNTAIVIINSLILLIMAACIISGFVYMGSGIGFWSLFLMFGFHSRDKNRNSDNE